MKAVRFFEYGSTDVLRLVEAEDPAVGKNQVRVRVAFAGVNPADYKWRKGLFRETVPISLPHTLGYDIAGTVNAIGEGVEGFAVGDRVFAMLDPVAKGGYAELAVADTAWLAKVPDNLDLETAAALPTAALAGIQIVEDHVCPGPGETVLITGAAGSVGRFAIYAARRAHAHVMAAVLASQLDQAIALGASQAIVLGAEAPADLSFNHVADLVGGDDVAALCRAVQPRGRIMTAATTPISPEGLVSTPTFLSVRPSGKGLETIGRLVADGVVPVQPVRALPLADAAMAHRLLETGNLAEKLILTI